MRHDRALWKIWRGGMFGFYVRRKINTLGRINRKEKEKVHQFLGSWSVRIKRRNNFPISEKKEDITHDSIFIRMIRKHCQFSSVQLLSRVRLFATPGLQHAGTPFHRQPPEIAQTHVHRVGDAIQPSHPLWSLSSSIFSLSQHQGLLQ